MKLIAVATILAVVAIVAVSFGNYKIIKERQIIFDGSSLSLFSCPDETQHVWGMRYPLKAFSELPHNYRLAFQNYAVGGQSTEELISDYPTRIAPHVKPNDIVVFWEITNDCHDLMNDTNGTQLEQNVKDYCALVRAQGARIIIVSMIARYMSGTDDSSIFSRRGLAVNALLRANWRNYADGFADVALLPQFDAPGDETNLTYYIDDGTHLKDAGYDLIATTVARAIQTLL